MSQIDRQLEIIRKLVCPICLEKLNAAQNPDQLVCSACGGAFGLRDGVPIMLVADVNWDKKQDEIKGEVTFNTQVVPPSTHLKRNAFLNSASRDLLITAGLNLSGKSVLVVGCSMAEAECFFPLCADLVGVDIVPDLTVMYKTACSQADMNVGWVCGDGECLPFTSESFDAVVVRQSLHHMLRYYSAISEFFRVCRVTGTVAIIDEPYSAPDLDNPSVARLPDSFPLYASASLGDLRNVILRRGEIRTSEPASPTHFDSLKPATDSYEMVFQDFSEIETTKAYIPALDGDAESLLADKYHRFSAVELIIAVRMHTDQFTLFWPDTIGWADRSGPEIVFCTGPNPAASLPLIDRLAEATTFSAVATKAAPTRHLRIRTNLVPAR